MGASAVRYSGGQISASTNCASGELAGTHSGRRGIKRTARSGTTRGVVDLIERGCIFADL